MTPQNIFCHQAIQFKAYKFKLQLHVLNIKAVPILRKYNGQCLISDPLAFISVSHI